MITYVIASSGGGREPNRQRSVFIINFRSNKNMDIYSDKSNFKNKFLNISYVVFNNRLSHKKHFTRLSVFHFVSIAYQCLEHNVT